MDGPDVYVIRVYRKVEGTLEGVVEAVHGGARQSFHDREQLWNALLDLASSWQRRQSHEPNQER